jgi:hypothetical protein
MTNSQADTGLSLTDAAAQLGISERTMLRRIKDGTVDGRKVGEGRGGVWRIYLSVSDSQPAPVSDSPTNAPGTLSDSPTDEHGNVSASVSDSQTQPAPEMIRMVELVDKLQAQNQQLAGQLGFTQAKLQEAERTVALLMAPKDEPAPEPPAELERRPWWKRWIG